MSLFDYLLSKDISGTDPGFYPLLFALIRKADTQNLARLELVFPAQVEEMTKRYNAPAGCLTASEMEVYDGYIATIQRNKDE